MIRSTSIADSATTGIRSMVRSLESAVTASGAGSRSRTVSSTNAAPPATT